MNKKNALRNALLISTAAILSACAGSAHHPILVTHQERDNALTCDEIDSELKQAKGIVKEVRYDKNTWEFSDVVDGVLWLPLNLVAKEFVYQESSNAANRRISLLTEMRKERNCYTPQTLLSKLQFDQSNKVETPSEPDKPKTRWSYAYQAEQTAREAGCITPDGTRPAAIALEPVNTTEVYAVKCVEQEMRVNCSQQGCILNR